MVSFDLDVLIREVGPFGKYQLVNYLLLCIPITLTTMYTLTYVFTAGDLSYRCKIPACDQIAPLDPLKSAFINFTVPAESPGKWSRCSTYEYIGGDSVSGDDVGDNTCRPEYFNPSVVQKCDEFVYQSDETTILSEFNLTCEQEWKLSLIGTINSVGQFLCLPLTGFVSDRYGRRTAFVMGVLTAGLFGVLRGFSVNYYMFAVFEFLEPLFGGGVYSSGFILAMEYVDPSKRVLGTSIINSFYTLGLAMLGGIAYATKDWRMLLWVLYAPCFIFISYFWILPESTRWLVTTGKYKRAQANILKAGKWNNTEFSEPAQKMLSSAHEEFMELQPKSGEHGTGMNASQEPKSEYPLLKAIQNMVILRRLLILSFCWAANTFVYYGLSIYSVSFAGDKYVNFISSSLIELPSVFICYFLVDTKLCGRKRSLIGMMLISGVACIFQLMIEQEDTTVISTGPFLLFLIGKLAITCAFVVVYIYTSELFPTELRHSLLGFCSMFGRIGSMVAPQVPLLGKYISSLPMILFGVIAISAGSLIFFLPETSNKELPDHIADAVRIEEGGSGNSTPEQNNRK